MKQWNGEEITNGWYGYPVHTGEFMGKEYIVVAPRNKSNGKWALKTEYFGAFPKVELHLLKLGYHIAHIKNKTRWCLDEDTAAQAAFIEFVHNEFGLSEKCIPIGMSCGGMQAIFLAAKHPEKVSCMYVDAPVVNYLSCPFYFAKQKKDGIAEEFIKARGINEIQILSFRHHPLDYLPALIAQDIPIILVSGDSDTVVPFTENGKLLEDAYREAGRTIETHMKPGGDHHPHSLPDNTPIIDFIEKYSG